MPLHKWLLPLPLSYLRTDFEINALGTFNVPEVVKLNDSSVILFCTSKVCDENVDEYQ